MLKSVKNLNSIFKFVLLKSFILSWSILFQSFNSLAYMSREIPGVISDPPSYIHRSKTAHIEYG